MYIGMGPCSKCGRQTQQKSAGAGLCRRCIKIFKDANKCAKHEYATHRGGKCCECRDDQFARYEATLQEIANAAPGGTALELRQAAADVLGV